MHRVLAALPGLLGARHRSEAAPLWVLTTNYDTLMKKTCSAATGKPYYLLYYMAGGVGPLTRWLVRGALP